MDDASVVGDEGVPVAAGIIAGEVVGGEADDESE